MLDLITKQLEATDNKLFKLYLLREFLQILILKNLRDLGAFQNIAFLGGTALRLLYGVNRYSEDLDFSVFKSTDYDFTQIISKLKNELILQGFDVELKYKESTVNSCLIKFVGLFHALNLSGLRDEKLSIKLEIDTNPPRGAFVELNIINHEFIFDINAYDPSSLMAGKLHAILSRKYSKGRDFYDLLWYLTSSIEPNLNLLNNALKQSGNQEIELNQLNWRQYLYSKLAKHDYKKIQEDVEPFLINKSELELINEATYKKLLGIN